MVAYGSGLSAQIGFAAEATGAVGTPVTGSMNHYEFLDESLMWEPTWLESEGLKAGQAYKRASRTVVSRYTISGDATFEVADRGHMGLLWKHALGSTATGASALGTGGAYRQIHTPGSKSHLSLTAQVGRPQPDATVRPFTYGGIKISEWEFSVSDGEIAQLKLTFDGWNESVSTSLVAASYSAAAGVFTFADSGTGSGGVFTLGGTATTSTGGLTTVASGAPVNTVIKGFTLTGTTPMATERYGLGRGGEKREQVENDVPTITGKLDGEFTDRTEIYDLFKSNSTLPLQLDLAHGDAGASNPFRLSFVIPAIKFKKAETNVGGPDIVEQSIEFEGYDDGSNPPIQVLLVSTDTGL